MLSLIEICKWVLNEELLGQYDNKYDVYKNPKSIKRMDPDMRGISDPKGNLYVVDDGGRVLIHRHIFDWLKQNKQIRSSLSVYDAGEDFEVMNWQRVGSSNTFKLAESYTKHDVLNIQKDPEAAALHNAVTKKNSKYTFKLESIWRS